MAAFSESRLVWSATLTMVVTTWLMLPAFSLRIASLALTRSAAPITWCMVSSMRARPNWPEPARVEVCSAAPETSLMVRTRSREVAAISREVAPISVVVAAVSVAVACCCLEVAAISVTEVVTCTEERWACDTRPLSSSAMPLKPVSMAPNSSRRPRFRRAVRSPPAIRSRLRTIFWIGWVIARNSRNPQMPATTTASNRVTSMLSSASSTALTMFSEARSAMSLFSSISSLRYLRPSRQCSVNGPATSLPASSKRFSRYSSSTLSCCSR